MYMLIDSFVGPLAICPLQKEIFYNEFKNTNSKQNNYTAVISNLNADKSSEIHIDAPIQYTL